MTSKKISELTTGSVLGGSELVMIVQGGVTKRTTIADIMAGSSTVGGELLAGETNAMGIDFTYHTDITKQHYISDLTTPANNYNSYPQGKLTYTSPSLKLCRQSDGVWRYGNHNVCLQSQTFGVTWATTNSTVTADQTTAPDGTSTADLLVGAASNAIHSIRMVGGTLSADATVAFSVFVKAGAYTKIGLRDASFTGVWASFDVSTVAVLDKYASASVTASITSVGNGWYRCVLNHVLGSTSTTSDIVALPNSYTTGDVNGSFTTDGTSGIYIWGAQIKRLPVNDAGGYTYATGYLATTSSAVYDLPYEWNAALASQGILIEEERTNLALQSQDFSNAAWTKGDVTITADNTTAPDGTSTADRVNITAGSAEHRIYQDAQGAAVACTTSIFVKAGSGVTHIGLGSGASAVSAVLNLSTGAITNVGASAVASVIDAGNGWWRFSVSDASGVNPYLIFKTGTSAAEAVQGTSWTAAGTETVYIWGAQYEAGAFPSSPIHTIAATVTRAVDNISILTSAIPFSTTVGSQIAQYVVPVYVSGLFTYVASISDGSPGNEAFNLLPENSIGSARVSVWDGSAPQANIDFTRPSAGTTAKIGMAWAVNDIAGCVDGGTVGTDASASLPTPDRVILGAYGSLQIVYVKQFTYLKRRATNGELQTRTT